MAKADDIETLITPTVTAAGCELWGVQLIQAKHAILRLYIDAEGGAGIEDCERVSRDVSRLLDVEDPISSEYTLEVSTPGLDRPLLKREHFARCAGEQISVRLRVPANGQRNFNGRLVGIEGDEVMLHDGDTVLRLPLMNIDKAQVVPQFETLRPKKPGKK